MVDSKDAIEPPKSTVEASEETSPAPWKTFAAWTAVLVLVNIILSVVAALSRDPPVLPDAFVGYVIGRALGLPIIVLLVSQIWKRFRNGRSRVGAIFYSSLIILFSLSLRLLGIVYVFYLYITQ